MLLVFGNDLLLRLRPDPLVRNCAKRKTLILLAPRSILAALRDLHLQQAEMDFAALAGSGLLLDDRGAACLFTVAGEKLATGVELAKVVC